MWRAILLGSMILCGAAMAADWEPMVGNDLSGWKVLGGEWTLQDGVIVGKTAKRDDNCWLMFEKKEFADFELEAEFMTPVPVNGGLQFRSHWLPRMPLKDGEAVDAAPRQMYGYQANIETRQRLATGRIMDENGRGYLAEPSKDACMTLKQRDWNRMRVVAKGPVIEVYLHDVLAARIEDEAFTKGFISLQSFAMDADQAEVQYRNIRIKDNGAEGNWRALFDGKSLNGWKEWGSEAWTVEEGAIVGRSGPKKSEGYLATVEQWKDFDVRGAFKMMGEGNFGLFYHSSITLKDDGYPVIAGVQGEVEPAYPSKTGWIYESYKRGWLVTPDAKGVAAAALRPGAWNEMEIRSKGSHVSTWVNGIRVVDFEDPEPKLTEGSFALQLHTGGTDGIFWKDLAVKE